MFGDGSLTFREAMMREPLPLATVHDAVLFEFLPDRDDAVLWGAQAVNAYVDVSRMTQDVDIVSPRAEDLAGEVRAFLDKRFNISVRVCGVRKGTGYRIGQIRQPKSRHLVDVWPVGSLPPCQRVEKVLVLSPPELIGEKVVCMVQRTKAARGFVDQADLFRLLLTFPALKSLEGPVAERLRAAGASPEVMAAWKELVAQEILPEDDDAEFGG